MSNVMYHNHDTRPMYPLSDHMMTTYALHILQRSSSIVKNEHLK